VRSLLGALVLALLAASCSLPGRATGPITLTAVFDDVGDLVVNHSVQVADVRIGSVTKIELTDDFKAKVTMSIKDVQVPKESEALLRTTSLLGEKFIELRPLSGDVDPTAGPFFEDGDTVEQTSEAPELEFVADQAVQVLGAVASNDLATLVHTGAVGFGGRGEELGALINDLSSLSATLADQTGNIVSVIDGLDQATSTLAASQGDLDQLLVNLSETTTVLAENRDRTVDALEQLTRLARVQNEAVFEPYLADVDRQVKQLDAILAEVASGRQEVGVLIDWLSTFVDRIPTGIPNSFAQVYGWFCPVSQPECRP
jgi:phospholipid/cholesterol/gamma-HCH transport system substrate-binding protein